MSLFTFPELPQPNRKRPCRGWRLLLTAVCLAIAGGMARGAQASTAQHTFGIGTNAFLLDGQPFQIRCGEMHAARVPREYWQQRLRMAHAMGLNAVCAYLFWNLHETQPGHFEWTGQADAAEFCRLAQAEGLWVLLRPGPYSCAEWEMGGLPWWLLTHGDVHLRSRDPRFLAAARNYLREVGRVLAPLQVTRGGPILMVQAENEYGSYGRDAAYMGDIRQALLEAGFEVPLFACNGPEQLTNGFRADLLPVVNFGSHPAAGFAALRAVHPQGPLMCGEFYPGWFDTWGVAHHTGKTEAYLADLEYMLKRNASFSIYMVHGGTTFGLWAGCDQPFKPDISSYDYDAPISEAGWPTDKFFKTRALFSRYLQPGERLPEVPARNPAVAVAPFALQECAPVFSNLPKALACEQPQPMESYGQGYGCILYRTQVPAGPAGALEAAFIHDFGYVFLDGRRVGVLDRREPKCRIPLPARSQAVRLDVLVEPMGRINYGPHINDHKGLGGPVRVVAAEGQTNALSHWEVFRLPLDTNMLAGLRFARPVSARGGAGPAFWRGHFRLEQAADTFLDLRSWGKGVVWVNGRCLGRFWNIGPTQTAYAPGPWLRKGENEIVVLDLVGPERAEAAGREQPILDELRPECDFGGK